jgi:hypothetical protein
MATSVHHSRNGTSVWERHLLGKRKGIDISSNEDGLVKPAAQDGNDSSNPDSRVHFLESELLQLSGDESGCLELLERDLRVLVQVVSPLNDLLLKLIGVLHVLNRIHI